MNRTIKFRGRTSGGYDDKGNPKEPRTVYGEGVYSDLYGTQIYFRTHNGIDTVPVVRESVAYFIGIDRNGNEVYEGDKLLNPHDGTTFKAAMNHIYTVKSYTLKD